MGDHEGQSFDLVIMMPGNDVSETFSGRDACEAYPRHADNRADTVSQRGVTPSDNEDFSGIDCIFSWLGNVDLLLR